MYHEGQTVRVRSNPLFPDYAVATVLDWNRHEAFVRIEAADQELWVPHNQVVECIGQQNHNAEPTPADLGNVS